MRPLSAAVLAVLLLASCSIQGSPMGTDAAPRPFELGPLPAGDRAASDISTVNGADADEFGPGATVNGTALELNAGGLELSWARYAVSIPELATVNRLEIFPGPSPDEFWLALADYGETNSWQWFGPYTGDVSHSFSMDAGRYLNPDDNNFYWIIATGADNALSVEYSRVDYINGAVPGAPPPGKQLADGGTCSHPSLVLLPSGAPSIVYTRASGDPPDSKLYVAYYVNGAWVNREIGGGNDFVRPQACWLSDANEATVCVYNTTLNKLVDLRFNDQWEPTGAADISAASSIDLSCASLDVDPASGELGLAHGYTDKEAGTGQLYYSWTAGGVWNTGAPLYDADRIGDVAFRFDPADGQPWMFYSHGTIDRSELILMDYTLEMGRLDGTQWNFSPVDYVDPEGNTSPLLLDLDFGVGGEALLGMCVARDHTYDFGIIQMTASVLLDGVVGIYDKTWEWSRFFESLTDYSVDWPNNTLSIDLDECSEANWARPMELQYSRVHGSLDIDLGSLEPSGGSFTTDVRYVTRPESTWIEELPSYFTGDPGRGFSWAGEDDPVCAYIRGESVDYAQVLDGNWEAVGELAYWSPPAP